jgi:hypothetical protein
MGIRIHKMLGYGFDDIVEDDPRFNVPVNKIASLNDGEYFPGNYEESCALAKQKEGEFITHLYQNGLDKCSVDYWTFFSKIHQKEEIKIDPYNFFYYDDEYGLENVCIFKPLFGFKDWQRFDDTIDYMEHIERRICNLPDDYVKVFRWSCLYPFQNFVDAKTGERLKKDPFSTVRMINSYLDKGEIPIPCNQWESFEHGSDGKYKTWKEFEQNVFPMVPESIVEFCKFYNIFKDEKTVHTLKPMLYVYWG